MKIFVQQASTGRFLTELKDWTDNLDEALEFISSMEALSFVVGNKLRGIQLFVRMEWENDPCLNEVLKNMATFSAHE